MKTRTFIKPVVSAFIAASMLLAGAWRSNLGAAATDALIEAAKREAELVYYASMNLSEANAIISEFE